MAKRDRFEAGFSLMELALVLLMIGLIIGGVLKGQDLIESARINSIQVQASDLRNATRTFHKKWDAWPGDISDADAARIAPGVGGMAAGTAGLGDGIVDGVRFGTTPSEATWFWHHLRAAGLLSGVPVVADGSLTTDQALKASLSGAFWGFDWVSGTVLSSNQYFGVPDVDHWFLLGARMNATSNHNPVLTPRQLRALDLKADDGMPNTGNIVGASEGSFACKSGSTATAPYVTTNGITCAAWFRL